MLAAHSARKSATDHCRSIFRLPYFPSVVQLYHTRNFPLNGRKDFNALVEGLVKLKSSSGAIALNRTGKISFIQSVITVRSLYRPTRGIKPVGSSLFSHQSWLNFSLPNRFLPVAFPISYKREYHPTYPFHHIHGILIAIDRIPAIQMPVPLNPFEVPLPNVYPINGSPVFSVTDQVSVMIFRLADIQKSFVCHQCQFVVPEDKTRNHQKTKSLSHPFIIPFFCRQPVTSEATRRCYSASCFIFTNRFN